MQPRLKAVTLRAALVVALLAAGLVSDPAAPSASAVSSAVVPIDFGQLARGRPTDANSVRLERYVLNTCKYGVGTWYDEVAKYKTQTGEYLDLKSLGGEKLPENIRPPGDFAQACAVSLATGSYDAAATGIPESTARARTIRMLASVAKSHKVNGGYWEYGTHFSTAHFTHAPAMAGWLLWNDMSVKDQELVRKMLEAMSNSLMNAKTQYYRDRSGKIISPGDTRSEELDWAQMVLSLGVNMMPDHANRLAWERKEFEVTLAGMARPSDTSSSAPYHGKPLSEWLNGSNLDEDGTVTNHDIDPHPHYMASAAGFYHQVLSYSLARKATPESARLNTQHVYRGLTDLQFSTNAGYRSPGGTIYKPDSPDIYFPDGNDKPSNEFIKYAYFDIVAGEFGGDSLSSREGAYWEELHGGKAAQLQNRFNDGHSNANLEEGGVEREHWIALWGSLAYLTKWVVQQGYDFHNQGPGPIDLDLTPRAEAPTIGPPGGTFPDPIEVTLTTSTAGATIYYTTDGTAPTTASTVYMRGFTVTDDADVRAIAAADGLSLSPEARASFIIGVPPVATSPTFRAVAVANATAATAVTVGRPTSSSSGDLLLALIRQKKTTAAVTPPPGWSLIRQDGSSARSSLYYKIAGNSEPAVYAFSTSTTADIAAQILAYTGVDTASSAGPIVAHGVKSNTGTSTGSTVVAPSLTPTVPGTRYVAIWSAKGTGLSTTPPAGLAERSDTSDSATLAAADGLLTTTSASGTKQASLSASTDRRIGQAVLLRPRP
ncbi:MAG: chitobiase/beta-hexosaminidase C-terminal domain-containing protein [Acidimicrobiales bacterium]